MADIRKPGQVSRAQPPKAPKTPITPRTPTRVVANATTSRRVQGQAIQSGNSRAKVPRIAPEGSLSTRNLPGMQGLVARFGYWDNPLRVVRYHNAVQSLPPEQRANLPLDEQGLSNAFTRLAEYNQGKPPERWEAPIDNGAEPFYEITRGMQEPPQEMKPYYEWQHATKDNPNPWKQAGMGDLYPMARAEAEGYFDSLDGFQTQGDNVLIPASMLYGEQGDISPEQPDQDMTNGIPTETYNRLKPWQRFLLNASPAGSGAAMGGGQGAVMGLIAGGPVGAVAGGALGGGLGGLFGLAADNPTAQKAISLLNVLDWPAEQTERALGLVSQIIDSALDPAQYGPINEIFDNLPAAWEAGHFTENVSFLGNTINAYEVTNPDPTTYQVDQRAVPSSLFLAEARKRLTQGESIESIEADLRARIGVRYDVQEAIFHMVLDPLNLIALGENALVKAGAKMAKNAPLLKAVDTIETLNQTRNIFNKAGGIDILGEYSRNLRLMKPDDLARFAPLSRFIAGVDEAGQLIDYATQPTARAAVAKAFQNLITLTPQSKANVLTYQLAQGLDVAIHDATDARQIEHTVKAVANLKPGDAVQGLEDANIMQWFESAEAQPAPGAVANALPRVETVLEAWKNVQDAPGRQGAVTMLQKVADAASTDGKKLAINDVIRMFGEAENKQDFERIYRGLADTIKANVDAGTIDKSILDEFLQGGYGKYAETARLFYGPDGIPFTLDQLKARVSAALAQGIEEYSVKHFGVKPRGWYERISNAVKGFQTMTMLNTPTFIANNYLNNILTLSWDGLIGVNTKRGRGSWLKGMGLDVEKMRIGMTAADLGKVGSEIDNAKKRPYEMGEEIRKATNANQSNMERKVSEFANKMSIFPRLGGAIERNASEQAYYSAIRPYWDAIWTGGKGFDRMGKEFKTLAGYLDSLQPGTSKKIEQMIARSKSRTEIEKAIFNGFQTSGIKDALSAEDMEILHAIPGLVDDIDKALKEARTPEDVRKAFTTTRERVTKQIRTETRKQARAKAETLLTRMQVEGMAGGAAAFDEVIDARASALMQHFDRMQAVADDIQARGLMGKERGAVWMRARGEEDQIFRAFEDDEAAKWLGMYQALGSTDTEANALLALLGDGSGDTMGLHSNWRRFFSQTAEEYANWHALPDDMPKIEKAKAWDELNTRLLDEYNQAVLEEDRVMERIDELTARLYARGKKDATYAYRDMLNWRLSQRDVRRKMAGTMSYYRSGKVPAGMEDWVDPALIEKVRGFTRGQPIHTVKSKIEKASLQEWFYKEVYRPLIGEAASVGHATQPKAPKPPAAPAQPTTQPQLPSTPPTAPRPRAQRQPTQPRAIETPAQPVPTVDQSALWRRIAETKPELVGVLPSGQFDGTAKLKAIKFVKKNGFGPTRTFKDITPEMWDTAVKNAQNRAELQPTIAEAPAPVDRRSAENAEMRARIAELEQEVATDEKTGAKSNKAFVAQLEKRKARGQNTAVGFLDVRGLGLTNKTLGNPVGDAYLSHIVKLAQEQGVDIYRTGGDEFSAIGDDIATLDDLLTAVSQRLEGSIIEVNGRRYAGAKYHHGVAADQGAADAIALERLRADPDAERILAKQYALRDATEGTNTDAAPGMDTGNESAIGSAGVETSRVQRDVLDRAEKAVRGDGDPTTAESAGQEASLKTAGAQPDWDEESYRTFLDMGDAVLINDETGEVFTPDMVTAEDLAILAVDDAGLPTTPREYLFTANPRSDLPAPIQSAMVREAEKMLNEIGKGFAPVMYKTENGKIIGRERNYANAPDWFTPTKEKTNRVERMRGALKRIINGTEAQANDNIGAEIAKMKQIILQKFVEGGEYNTLFYLGEYQNLWDNLGENITRMMGDPNTTADTWRQAYGDNAGDMIWLHDQFNKVEDAATDPLPTVDPADLEDTALRLADNIDEAEAAINIEEQFTRTKDDFERAVMEAMPDDGDLVIDLVESLSKNFNPEIDTQDFYNRMGWKFGGEFQGEEGLARIVKDRIYATPSPKGAITQIYEVPSHKKVWHVGSSDPTDLEGRNFDTIEDAISYAEEIGYRITNKSPRGYNLEHVETQAEVNRLTEISNQKWANASAVFLRFGDPPASGKSFNKRDGVYESGISVYRGEMLPSGEVRLSPGSSGEEGLGYEFFKSTPNKKLYVVDGEEIGIGSDGEPLLKNVKIKQTVKKGLFRSAPSGVDGLTTFTEQGRALMRVYKATDPTAAAHELIHGITPLMQQADADLLRTDLFADMPDLPEDWHTAMGYVGTGDQLTAMFPDAYERLSRAFERYLADGLAPTAGLQGLFTRMKNWMLAVYKRIAGGELDVEISPETRRMFDRWVAGEQEAPMVETAPGPTAPYRIETGKVGLGKGKFAAFDESGMVTNWFDTPDQARTDFERIQAGREAADSTRKSFEATVQKGLAGETLTDGDLFTVFGSTYGEMNLDYIAGWLRFEMGKVNQRGALKDIKAFLTEKLKGKSRINSNGDRVYTSQSAFDAVREYPGFSEKFTAPQIAPEPQAVVNLDVPTQDVTPSLWDKPGQMSMFQTGEDLPLFSGTAQRAQAETFAPKPENQQPAMFDMREQLPTIEARQAEGGAEGTPLFEGSPEVKPVETAGTEPPRPEPPTRVYTGGREQNRTTTNMGDLAADYKYRGMDKYKAWDQFIIDRNLKPDANAKEFYDTFEAVNASPLRPVGGEEIAFNPTHWDTLFNRYVQINQDNNGVYQMVWDNGRSGSNPPSFPPEAERYTSLTQPPRTRTEGLLFRTSPDAEPLPLDTRDLPVGTVDQMSTPPTDSALLEMLRDKIMPMLDRAETTLASDATRGNKLFDFESLDPEMRKQLRAYMGKVGGQMGDAKLAALRYGKAKRDFALLPYERRYNADTYLQGVMPYEFWYTRSMMNWAVRALNKPTIISNYMRLMQFFNEQQGRDGFPTRLKKKSFIRLPFLREWMGEGVYVDPMKQAFPFLQLLQPFERMYSQENQAKQRATTLLQQQVEDGTMDAAEAQQAIQSMSGLTWQEALAQAKNEIDADVQNPLDFAFMISGASLPINILRKYAEGRQDEISQLPITRLIQNATAPLGIGGPRGVNIEAGIRGIAGLPEMDRFEDYRVDRMLAGMAADGDISSEDAQRAMIDREGEAFTLAQRKVSQMGFFQYVGAPVALDFFPEGEQDLRALRDVYGKAYEKYKNGDKTALTKFFDKHPEYQARMSSFQEPEERLKRFLISEVWERYNAMPAIYKQQAREQLGDTFNDAFLSKETRSYDSISAQTLAAWARGMGTDSLPNRTPDTPQIGLKFAPKETADAVEAYNAEADQLFPGIGKFLSSFYQMPQEEQDAARKQYPEIQAYYDWKNKYLAENPVIIPWVTSEKSELFGMPQELQQTVYKYRAQRAELFPGVDQMQDEYFNSQDSKAYLKQNPALADYWDWRKAYAAQNPTAAPYILSDAALSKAILEPNPTDMLSEDQLAQISDTTQRHLMAYFLTKEPIRSGPMAELDELWNQFGKPYGTLKKWINGEVKNTLAGGRY